MAKRRLLACCAAVALSAAAAPALAQTGDRPAQTPARMTTFAIPAQPLDAALIAFAQAADVDVLYTPDQVRGRRAGPVSGVLAPTEALRRLLAGTGLQAVTTDGGRTFALRPVQSAEVQADPEAVATIDEVVVTGVRNALAAERYRAAVPVDVLTQEDFGRYTGSDVADLVTRIPGVSLSNTGSFAVIRGLSERYNTVTFDGLVLPSSDPERQGVELDQFPTRLLAGIVVQKAFTPEQPGNLSGGGVDLRPLRFPNDRIFNFTMGVSAGEDVFTGDQNFLTYDSPGNNDLWARGSQDRLSTDDIYGGPSTIAPRTDRPFVVERGSMPVAPRFALTYGDSFEVGAEGKLGLSLGLSYDSAFGSEAGSVNEGISYGTARVRPNAQGEDQVVISWSAEGLPRAYYDYLRSEATVTIGALGNLSYSWNPNHQIGLTGFLSQTGTDLAEHDYNLIHLSDTPYVGTPESANPAYNLGGITLAETAHRWRDKLDYRERNLSLLALSGDHLFPNINDAVLSWSAAVVSAYQDEPDSRRVTYTQPYGTDYFELRSGTDIEGAISNQWRKTEEDLETYRLSWQQPLGDTAFFEIGGAFGETARTYSERIGGGNIPLGAAPYSFGHYADPADISATISSYLLPAASVELSRGIDALYLRAEGDLFGGAVRVSGGVRFEQTRIMAEGYGQVPGTSGLSSVIHYTNGTNMTRGYWGDIPSMAGLTEAEQEAVFSPDIDQIDFLPSISIIWTPINDLTLRLSASETIARPSLREVGNYYSWNFETDRYQHGNGLLQLSEVRNLDFRAEYQFGGGDRAALSLFRKEIDNPIELGTVAYPTNNGAEVETWFNNINTAELQGAEFEFRKNFGFLGAWLGEGPRRWLGGLTLGGNATWIDAHVAPHRFTGSGQNRGEKPGELLDFFGDRRLYDQPEWIANLDATYDYDPWGSSVTLSWTAISDVMTAVGSTFDQMRDETSRLDIVFSQRITDRYALRFTGRNLLDPEQRLIRDRDQTGGVEIVDRRWREGRSFSLTLSAEF